MKSAGTMMRGHAAFGDAVLPRRGQVTNIPIELLRTVLTIFETGSFTKASVRLGITQPGVSSQIKRLQALVGGTVFERVGAAIQPTERGKLILPLARQILEANDQIARIGGATPVADPLCVGTSALLSHLVLDAVAGFDHAKVNFVCDSPEEIAHGIREGYIDVGCFIGSSGRGLPLSVKWQEKLVWTRAKNFVLSPGTAVPLVGSPDCDEDRVAIDALQRKGMAYRLAFVATDLTSRLAAVSHGIGLAPLPERLVRGDLVVANEYYLPALGELEAGISLREDLAWQRVRPLYERLAAKLVPVSAKPSPPHHAMPNVCALPQGCH